MGPKNKLHHIRKNTSENIADIGSCGGTGISTTSPRNIGAMTFIADCNHSKYASRANAGVRYSSITLFAIRSVMTHSSPLPTSILISRSLGATRIRSPLSNHL